MTGESVGVVGAGNIGRTHLKAYQDAGALPVAVTDTDPQAAEAVAVEFGLTAYPDLTTMLAEADLYAVSICTPPAAHHDAAVQALQAGVPVLCEKPMARSAAECESMVVASTETGTLLAIGLCHRFQPEIETMRRLVADGLIGAPLTFRNRFSGPLASVESRWFSQPEIAGGGCLMDSSVHSIDIFRYVIGEVDQVVAVTATTGTDRGPALAVEDSAIMAVRSVGGVLGVIEASWRTAPGEALVSVSGTQGRLDMDYGSSTLSLTKPGGETNVIDVEPGNRFTREARSFLDCIRSGDQPRVTAADGARAVELLMRAYQSAGTLTPATATATV